MRTDQAPGSFFWYDLETSGTDPASDRIMQFAGQRTDADLRPVGEPVVAWARLGPEVLPQPEACLVTGLTPQWVEANGEDEWQVCRRAQEEFLAQPDTCVAGYNNLRFDDEFLRYGLYRSLLDPYAREWQNGNSRWDLIDLARAACALRPEGVRWPEEEGAPTFRLERLCAANDIRHHQPHDARGDVAATIALARLLKAAQPKLWRYALANRRREAARELLLPLGRRICAHVSGRFASARRCLAPVVSVAEHPAVPARLIVADLAQDVAPLVECDVVELRQRLFSPVDEAAEQPPADRPPLKVVVTNRCPFLAPVEVVRPADAQRLSLDMDVVRRRRDQLAAVSGLAEKVAAVYVRDDAREAPGDAEFALYDGFVGDDDRRRMERLQQALTNVASWRGTEPKDPRLATLRQRLLARLRPDAVGAADRAAWERHAQSCLAVGFGSRPSLAEYQRQVAALEAEAADAKVRTVLRALAAYPPAASGEGAGSA